MIILKKTRIGKWLEIEWKCENCSKITVGIFYDLAKSIHCPHCKHKTAQNFLRGGFPVGT
jgi:ribosomal protein S27E